MNAGVRWATFLCLVFISSLIAELGKANFSQSNIANCMLSPEELLSVKPERRDASLGMVSTYLKIDCRSSAVPFLQELQRQFNDLYVTKLNGCKKPVLRWYQEDGAEKFSLTYKPRSVKGAGKILSHHYRNIASKFDCPKVKAKLVLRISFYPGVEGCNCVPVLDALKRALWAELEFGESIHILDKKTTQKYNMNGLLGYQEVTDLVVENSIHNPLLNYKGSIDGGERSLALIGGSGEFCSLRYDKNIIHSKKRGAKGQSEFLCFVHLHALANGDRVVRLEKERPIAGLGKLLGQVNTEIFDDSCINIFRNRDVLSYGVSELEVFLCNLASVAEQKTPFQKALLIASFKHVLDAHPEGFDLKDIVDELSDRHQKSGDNRYVPLVQDLAIYATGPLKGLLNGEPDVYIGRDNLQYYYCESNRFTKCSGFSAVVSGAVAVICGALSKATEVPTVLWASSMKEGASERILEIFAENEKAWLWTDIAVDGGSNLNRPLFDMHIYGRIYRSCLEELEVRDGFKLGEHGKSLVAALELGGLRDCSEFAVCEPDALARPQTGVFGIALSDVFQLACQNTLKDSEYIEDKVRGLIE